jgi:5-methylcytosine-specific restriction protein A
MNMQMDNQFTEFLREKAAEAKLSIGYHPTKFLGMLGADGGFKTANRLLAAPQVSDGFTKLFMGNRLDLSVEALVVESKWRDFFEPALIAHAEKVLRRSNYPFKPYNASGQSPKTTPPSITEVVKSPSDLREPPPVKSTNSVSFSGFCEQLGTPLKNVMDRWCGSSEARRRAVFTIWADRLIDGKYVFWNDVESPKDTRIGARELGETITAAMNGKYDVYGILCEAEDTDAHPRKRRRFDSENLLVLRFATESPGVVAYLVGEVAAASVVTGALLTVRPFASAINDLDQTPAGVTVPVRTSGTSSGYRRDDAVRKYVLRRAAGHCEHCHAPGFELPDGTLYLEAHHVIALGKLGPDTVDNVIALCPHHHRQAHYGREANALEAKFLQRLEKIAKG